MNTIAVETFIRNRYKDAPDGIGIFETDGHIIFPIRTRSKEVDHYMLYFVRPNDNREKYLKFGVRIPDHSELGATRVGWQLRLKTILDKALEEFREFIRKHESSESTVQVDSERYTPGGHETPGKKR